MSARRRRLFVFGVLGAAAGLRLGAAEEAKNRYDYWARFKPGTSVTFRIRTRGVGADQEILKTFAVKNVTPQSVLIEYREALPPGAKPKAENPAVLLGGVIEFPAYEVPREGDDLFGSQMSFNPFRAWEKEEGAEVGKGNEELTVKGIKISASLTQIRFRAARVATTITVWRSEEVPGTIVKGRREIRLSGETPLREEFEAVEFRVIPADPAEIARLRADRKPETVEESGLEFVDAHFRFMKDLDSTANTSKSLMETFMKIVPRGSDADWESASKEWLRYQAASQVLQDHLGEDRRSVEARLDPAEFKKLDSFLKEAGGLADYHLKQADIIRRLSEFFVSFPENMPSPAQIDSIMQDLATFSAGFQATLKRATAEFLKLGSVRIKSIR